MYMKLSCTKLEEHYFKISTHKNRTFSNTLNIFRVDVVYISCNFNATFTIELRWFILSQFTHDSCCFCQYVLFILCLLIFRVFSAPSAAAPLATARMSQGTFALLPISSLLHFFCMCRSLVIIVSGCLSIFLELLAIFITNC